jgi:hypothetical protein
MKPVSSVEIDQYTFSTFGERPALATPIYEVKQIHSATILKWSKQDLSSLEADGICLIFDQLKEDDRASGPINLGIKTADCLSVAIIGDKGVINLHAGWRGLASNILSHPFIEECRPHTFYLSPAISNENYHVGEEFKEIFKLYPQSFKIVDRKLTFSLHITAIKMIKSMYPNSKVIVNKLDTYSHSQLNSYRQNRTSKRNWNILSFNFSV